MGEEKKTKAVVWEIGQKTPDEEPPNNDGRSICYWCGANTVKKEGLFDVYDICEACDR